MSTHPHPPKIYLHLLPPTPIHPSKMFHPPLSTQKILPPTRNLSWSTSTHSLNHPEYTSTHPCPFIKKCPPSPIQPKYTSRHPHLPKQISTHRQPPKINFIHPHLTHNIKPFIIIYRRVVLKFKSQHLDLYSFCSIALRKYY